MTFGVASTTTSGINNNNSPVPPPRAGWPVRAELLTRPLGEDGINNNNNNNSKTLCVRNNNNNVRARVTTTKGTTLVLRVGRLFLRLSAVFFATRISAHCLRIPTHYQRIICAFSAFSRMQPNASCILGRVGVFATRIHAHFRAFIAHIRRTFCAFCTLSTDVG